MLVTMAIRTMVPILALIIAVTPAIATTIGVHGAAAIDEALSMSVATLSANLSNGATVMGAAIAVLAVIIRMGAVATTVTIHMEAIEGLGAMAIPVSGVIGHCRSPAGMARMARMPKDMRSRRGRLSLYRIGATTFEAVRGWKWAV